MNYRIVLFCGLSTLAGCASFDGLNPQGRQAQHGEIASAQSLASTKLSSVAWPDARWWSRLGDPQLDVLVDEALQNNPDLAAAQARLRLSAAQTLGADAARQLHADVKASLPGSQLPKGLIPGEGGDYSTAKLISASANYEFDLWGGKRAAWEAAVGQQRASEVDARAAELLLATRITQAYNELNFSFVSEDIMREDLDRAQRLLALTRQRVAAGLDSLAQQWQAEATVASAEQKLAQSQQQIESQRIRLAVLLGKGPDRGLGIERSKALQPGEVALPENLPAELLGRRPDIVAARWRVEAASHSIDAAKARFYPNVNLSATVGLLSLHTADLFQSSSRFALVTPAISLPLFDGGKLRADLASRDAEYDLAVAQYNKTLVSAFNEVADSLSRIRSLQVQETAQQRALTNAREAWDLATQRYRTGVGGYVDVLLVQQTLHLAEERVAEIQTARVLASLDLIRALGGGFHGPNVAELTRDGGKAFVQVDTERKVRGKVDANVDKSATRSSPVLSGSE